LRLPLPAPPRENAAASENQTGQARADDWAGDDCRGRNDIVGGWGEICNRSTVDLPTDAGRKGAETARERVGPGYSRSACFKAEVE